MISDIPTFSGKFAIVFACVAVACGVLDSPSTSATHPPDTLRPNVLLIIVDDLGFADLSCQGSSDMQTPHIDNLFSDSLRLSRFYANCPVCSPTRASVLTGCYPDRVGVPGVIRTHETNNWGNRGSCISPTTPPTRRSNHQTIGWKR